MTVTDQMINDGPAVYYTDEFRNVLEDHMTYLRNHSLTVMVPVLPSESYHYDHDLFGYLRYKGVPTELHWVIMRMNNWFSPRAFSQNASALLWPDKPTVDKIQQSFSSGNRIT